jgi:polyphosphate glucokinase
MAGRIVSHWDGRHKPAQPRSSKRRPPSMLAAMATLSTSLVACHALPSFAMRTLAIDIGGSGLKAAILGPDGQFLGDRARIDTPVGSPPAAIVAALAELAQPLGAFERIAVGFPGMVRNGVVRTAPNLQHAEWSGFDLATALANALGRPTRVANDADVHGFAVIQSRGLEMVVTLGTGFGTALYENGRLCPHLEISQQTFRKGETFDQQLGEAARKEVGNKKWQKRVVRAIAALRTLTHFDHLYIGGGNARRLTGELPADVTLVDNSAGLTGGARLWAEE